MFSFDDFTFCRVLLFAIIYLQSSELVPSSKSELAAGSQINQEHSHRSQNLSQVFIYGLFNHQQMPVV